MTNEEIEKRITLIEHDVSREIHLLKTKIFKMEIRFESLLRYLIWEGDLGATTFTIERFQEAVNDFQTLNRKVQEINALPSITEKVAAAEAFNSSDKFTRSTKAKIYGDDLGLKAMIENAGGTSSMTAVEILACLPCSQELTNFLKSYVVPDHISNKVISFPEKVE